MIFTLALFMLIVVLICSQFLPGEKVENVLVEVAYRELAVCAQRSANHSGHQRHNDDPAHGRDRQRMACVAVEHAISRS